MNLGAPDDICIDGILCVGSVFASIYLHENGKLKECRLAENIVIQGKKFQKGLNIRFDFNGNILP